MTLKWWSNFKSQQKSIQYRKRLQKIIVVRNIKSRLILSLSRYVIFADQATTAPAKFLTIYSVITSRT